MNDKRHLWQGEWIGDAELERRLDELGRWIEPELEKEPRIEPVLQACESLKQELSAHASLARELVRTLVEAGVAQEQEAWQAIGEIAEALSRHSLEFKLKRELGSVRPFVEARVRSGVVADDAVFEAWTPLGLLAHVSPQNAFTVGPMSVLEGLLSGNVNFLKTGANESLFPQLFLEALCRRDATGWVSKRVIAARISSKRRDLIEKVFKESDGIAAWGGEESTEAIRRLAPSGSRVIEWGHKISFIYVTRAALDRSPDLYERIARECCWLEQQACSSPQCVYLETRDWGELERFGERLAEAFGRISREIPRTEPSESEAAEISMITECQRLEQSFGKAKVIAAGDGSWRVLMDERPSLQASPLFRTIWVKPLSKDRILATLRPMRKYLQTTGLVCGLPEVEPISRTLRAAGVERIRRVGEMLQSYSGEPHDGVYALQRYCRRTSIQLGQEASSISNFQEIKGNEPPTFAPGIGVTSKDSFSNDPVDPSRARLFFKSGGSTGEPKLSTYDYDQYHEQMRLGADGLVAAGFEPLRDRAMNLFFSGALYGGFLSIFSTLEVLEAIQFPMAAQADHRMVADTIINNRVDTLLGMPSYILQLFENERELLASYGRIKKIFYGGEHFSEAQMRFLREGFGVEVIRSVAYGSVDIGPIGYQCGYCEGGVHHLHHGVQYLEILKMDDDRPVEGDEVGRLIFSPRGVTSNKPLRYEIGDVGHWVGARSEGCACGRQAPRFRLLGRMGDIFRIGSMFFHYQKFGQILSSRENYPGEIQLILENQGLKEALVLLFARNPVMDEKVCRDACLEGYPDLAEAVVEDRVLLFETRAVDPGSFERTKGSGKLRHILDRRTRA